MDALQKYDGQLRAARTAAEFSALISSLDSELDAAMARRAELDKAEDRAIFGDGDVAEVRASIAECNSTIGTLEKVIDAAGRRRDEASANEDVAALEAVGAEARKQAAELDSRWAKAAGFIHSARAEMAAIDRLNTSITRKNMQFESAGRGDLRINLSGIQRGAVGERPPLIKDLSRDGMDMDQALIEEIHPRHPARRPPIGAIRHNRGQQL